MTVMVGMLIALLSTSCGFRHCTEIAANRDDTRAALCSAQCRCIAPENYEPVKVTPP